VPQPTISWRNVLYQQQTGQKGCFSFSGNWGVCSILGKYFWWSFLDLSARFRKDSQCFCVQKRSSCSFEAAMANCMQLSVRPHSQISNKDTNFASFYLNWMYLLRNESPSCPVLQLFCWAFGKFSGQISFRRLPILTAASRAFPQSIQKYAGIFPRTSAQLLLSNSLFIIIIKSSYHWAFVASATHSFVT
jgi:hypothetical protein